MLLDVSTLWYIIQTNVLKIILEIYAYSFD